MFLENQNAVKREVRMKKAKDVGLQYMMELGLRPAKTIDQFYSMLRDKIGKEKAAEIEKYINERGEAEGHIEKSDDKAFYKLKNSSLDVSLAISGGFDGNFIRQTCNYIASAADKYRNCARILEVGCDCGIFSCFLGRTFPTAKIVSIDQCESSIAVAKELAQRLGVSNVTFLHADIHDCPEEKYDAIFSIRVMHEARSHDEKEDHTLLMDTQAEMYAAVTAPYAQALSNKLADNGLLLSIERCGLNPLFYGWMLALNEQGIVIQSYGQLSCQEAEEEKYFQVLDMKKENNPWTQDEIRNQFAACFFGENGELTETDFYGWEATLVLQLLHGDLIDGVFAYVNEEKVGKLALWKSAECESDILVEQYLIRKMWDLSVRDVAMLEEAMQQISADKEFMEEIWGATLKPFKVVDGKEVEI